MKIQYIIASIACGLALAYPFVMHSTSAPSRSNIAESGIPVETSNGLDQRTIGQTGPLLGGSAAIGPKKGDQDQGLQGKPQNIDSIIGNAEIKTQ